MPFELRQFERLLNEDIEELEGWRMLAEPPPLVHEIACSITCATCLCPTADLYQLLSPQQPDEAALLRQQLAVAQQQLARTEEERDELSAQCDAHAKARKIIGQAARRRKNRIASLKAKMMKLTEACHLRQDERGHGAEHHECRHRAHARLFADGVLKCTAISTVDRVIEMYSRVTVHFILSYKNRYSTRRIDRNRGLGASQPISVTGREIDQPASQISVAAERKLAYFFSSPPAAASNATHRSGTGGTWSTRLVSCVIAEDQDRVRPRVSVVCWWCAHGGLVRRQRCGGGARRARG